MREEAGRKLRGQQRRWGISVEEIQTLGLLEGREESQEGGSAVLDAPEGV